jgi:hypothetical protein
MDILIHFGELMLAVMCSNLSLLLYQTCFVVSSVGIFYCCLFIDVFVLLIND